VSWEELSKYVPETWLLIPIALIFILIIFSVVFYIVVLINSARKRNRLIEKIGNGEVEITIEDRK